MNIEVTRYPRRITCGEQPVELRRLAPDDGAAVAAFVQTLPPHDLLFLRRDIGAPQVVAAWMDGIREGRVQSLAACAGGALVGCTAIVVEPLSWSRHVGELRVLVAPALRGQGLGRQLIQECFVQALEMGLDKLCAQMTVDQTAAIAVFEELGFRAEALLRQQVKDRDGRAHDLALLCHDVRQVQATLDAYGVSAVFAGPQEGA